ncbi:hypothetical protein HWD35_08425 [Tsukamurella tyrosinosolvens]|uniref:hypothetical protein n=1 Tax=Tsukamurella tyrosinosolvens TaxID=57704 RepID=UPI000792C2D5|nr:hypothetical protein [Tsukamurella tyrosinosolvens]KXP07333.1 hypothetical protein AXK59_04450 [Tsukamurella tyrosinosolvens]KZL98534.1 hypothetical protein AXX05_06600 [Tsukamurella tyrosinosolvens]MCA4994732.1 hypothetical protein [Tsukamurella tyrosinosolvens]
MNPLRTLLAALIATLSVLAALPAIAHAERTLAPGDTIDTDTGSCSIGYFATDPSGGLYIVTAGHCSDHTDSAVAADGIEIGTVVAGYDECRGDGACEFGKYGITIIRLHRGTDITLRHWWTSVRDAAVGDEVCISGGGDRTTRCGVTETATASFTNVRGIESVPGDSGSGAWGGPDYRLVGLVISRGEGTTQVQPVSDAQAKARRLGYDLSILVR